MIDGLEAFAGKVIAIEATSEAPDSGIYALDPQTRQLANPKRLQAFIVSATGLLERTDREPEVTVRLMQGVWLR